MEKGSSFEMGVIANLRSLIPLPVSIQHQLPCDYEITSLRPFADVEKWLLIMHRSVVDCGVVTGAKVMCRVDEKEKEVNVGD